MIIIGANRLIVLKYPFWRRTYQYHNTVVNVGKFIRNLLKKRVPGKFLAIIHNSGTHFQAEEDRGREP